MITREQAEYLATLLAVKKSKWEMVITESRPQALREILKDREEILDILDKELHRISK